jgi:hypothetical protein
MARMSDRGLPIVDGAPACPFVAFEDDRDARAGSPDHRHRCYAEVRPAPRALAHQEAYCLSSSFPICPTFQDWARREAAKATAAAATIPPAVIPGADPGPGATDRTQGHPADDIPRRNPPRDWSAPPPWLGAEQEHEDDDERDIGPLPRRGAGLSGSFADRLVSATPAAAAEPSAAVPPPVWRDSPPGTVTEPVQAHLAAPARDDEADDEPRSRSAPLAPRRAASPAHRGERERIVDEAGPVWERPRRREAYPTIKTRMGLGGFSVPSILIGLAAVLIAAVALFFLPALLGIGNPASTSAPSSSPGSSAAAASPSPAGPTVVPAPTPQIYVVQAGDTMSKIASRFGIPLQTLIDANKTTIPNPDRLNIGDQVTIPAAIPTSLPGANASASP